jgi:hypothetical protein
MLQQVEARPQVVVEPGSVPVRCRKNGCNGLLGWLSDGVFRRSLSYDLIEAPATIHVKCSCGFVNTLRLRMAGGV